MKHVLCAAAFALGMLALVSSEASAWVCRADSRTGAFGWGSSASLRAARSRALWECARRTPRGYTCYLTGCR
jgi:hypothetical protein